MECGATPSYTSLSAAAEQTSAHPLDDTNQPNRFRCAAWLNFLLRKVYIERLSTRIGACVARVCESCMIISQSPHPSPALHCSSASLTSSSSCDSTSLSPVPSPYLFLLLFLCLLCDSPHIWPSLCVCVSLCAWVFELIAQNFMLIFINFIDAPRYTPRFPRYPTPAPPYPQKGLFN